ncbi:MAG: FHA domain-containing protein [Pyrinomonadaceae bacterium]
MPETPQTSKKSITADWLVQGVLTKIGDMFDRLTGRGWKPSSSLATSELVERLKRLLDAEVRENGDKRKFVPHNIKLKMQWDKFSTDAGDSLQALEEELLTAAVDHINDKLYYTYAPLSIEVKPDYFTSGVKLFVSYEKFSNGEHEAEMDVAIPGAAAELPAAEETARAAETATARFNISGQERQKELRFEEGARLSIGRTKENDLALDDPSVSKMHASLLLDAQSRLYVADTGSTNGTFIDGERISYGKAIEVGRGGKVKFGTVEVELEFKPKPVTAPPELPKMEAYKIGEFEFTQKIETE